MSESFPCIICGGALERVSPDAEGQPDDGIMCISYGNYGSTVFDPDDLSYLAFNICDECIVDKANAGAVMVTRGFMPVDVAGERVGKARAEREYIRWRKGMPSDGAEMDLSLFEDFDAVIATGRVLLHVPVEYVRERLRRNHEAQGRDDVTTDRSES